MKLSFAKNDILRWLKQVALDLLGTIVLSFGCAVFIIPFELVSGGATGLAIVIDAILPNEIFGINVTVDLIVGALVWVLFFIGLIVLGWNLRQKRFYLPSYIRWAYQYL